MTPLFRIPRSILFATLGLLSIGGSTAVAHGPTVELSHDSMKPPLLNLFVGTTVHFLNTVETPAGQVVVDGAGTIESPPLVEVGAGWHYTFETLGTFEMRLRGPSEAVDPTPAEAGEPPEAEAEAESKEPAAMMRIVIVPRRGPNAAVGARKAPAAHPAHEGHADH